ncbi:TetR/AcrR family transcriptional regulator [Streptomyces sp. NPDC004111]|uniref:TetR/AcrR family transcriptional regulator n=1 Tax=Streptomyces sp. NPDC004111 TaxID=3364690 RepID=UPI00369C6794
MPHAERTPTGQQPKPKPEFDPQQLWLGTGAPRSGRGRKPAFTREAITAAAVALADAEGLEAVTMRRVAAEVGAGVMSLYSYAPDKETLLELMVDHVSAELEPGAGAGTGTEAGTPAEPGPGAGTEARSGATSEAAAGAAAEAKSGAASAKSPRAVVVSPLTGDWRADLKTIGHLQRALMLRHRWLPAALTIRRSLGPHALAFLEHALAALRPTGLDGAAKLEVFSQLTGFVAAYVGQEITRSEAAHHPGRLAAEVRYLTAVAADGRHPELAAALGAPARPQSPDAMFTRFLDRLVDGLDSEAPATGRTESPGGDAPQAP